MRNGIGKCRLIQVFGPNLEIDRGMKTLMPFVTVVYLALNGLAASQVLAEDMAAPSDPSVDEAPVVRRQVRKAEPLVKTESVSQVTPQNDDQSGTGLVWVVSGGGNSLNLPSTDSSSRTSLSGYGFFGKTGFTVLTQKLALDVHFGIIQTTVRGKELVTIGNRVTTSDRVILTRTGLFEVSPKYRLMRGLEVGPLAGVWFGGDTSFQEAAESRIAPLYVGAKISGGLEGRYTYWRISGTWQRTMTLPLVQAQSFAIGLEIGLPLIKAQTIVKETTVSTTRDNFETEIIDREKVITKIEEKEVIKEVEKRVVNFSLDEQIVHFELNQAAVLPSSRKFLTELGSYLSAHGSEWKKLAIEGHTDVRGSDEYNMALSQSRANLIVKILSESGVPAEKLQAIGMGESRVLDQNNDEIAHARNRRVELAFDEVENPKQFRSDVNRIQWRNMIPATCHGPRCR